MAAAFPQLEQAAAFEVALAFADPGLLLAQLAHEQVQLPLHDVHLALRQLLLAPPQLLLLEALLLRCPQQLLLPAAELLERRQAAWGEGLSFSAARVDPCLVGVLHRASCCGANWGHNPAHTSLAKLGARAGDCVSPKKGCLFRFDF